MRNLASRLQARLEAKLVEGADAAQMIVSAVALWMDIAAVLSPIIGTVGMAALYRRALSMSVIDSPSLALALQEASAHNDFTELRTALSAQSCGDVVKCNAVLLRNFFELLATLIGGPLTERLLNRVPDIAASGRPPQEPPI